MQKLFGMSLDTLDTPSHARAGGGATGKRGSGDDVRTMRAEHGLES